MCLPRPYRITEKCSLSFAGCSKLAQQWLQVKNDSRKSDATGQYFRGILK